MIINCKWPRTLVNLGESRPKNSAQRRAHFLAHRNAARYSVVGFGAESLSVISPQEFGPKESAFLGAQKCPLLHRMQDANLSSCLEHIVCRGSHLKNSVQTRAPFLALRNAPCYAECGTITCRRVWSRKFVRGHPAEV